MTQNALGSTSDKHFVFLNVYGGLRLWRFEGLVKNLCFSRKIKTNVTVLIHWIGKPDTDASVTRLLKLKMTSR